MHFRQYVTGHSVSADVASEIAPRRLALGSRSPIDVVDVWGSDAPVNTLGTNRRPAYASYFPPVGGFRVLVIEWRPLCDVTDDDLAAYLRTRDSAMVGYTRDTSTDPNDPSMHATDTVDIGVIMEGELTMDVGGERTLLRAGDVVVQNGTFHAWRNLSDRICRAAFFVLGASRELVPPAIH